VLPPTWRWKQQDLLKCLQDYPTTRCHIQGNRNLGLFRLCSAISISEPTKIISSLWTLSNILTGYFRNTNLKRYRPVELCGGISFTHIDTLLWRCGGWRWWRGGRRGRGWGGEGGEGGDFTTMPLGTASLTLCLRSIKTRFGVTLWLPRFLVPWTTKIHAQCKELITFNHQPVL
jgi:hypothetical protein